MRGAPQRGLARPWCGRALRPRSRRAVSRFGRAGTSSSRMRGSPACASESRSRANHIERLAHRPPLREPYPEESIEGPNRGRFERRRSRASCCRSAKFSRTRSVRAPSAARRAPSRASTRCIAVQPRLPADLRPACRSSSGQRQVRRYSETPRFAAPHRLGRIATRHPGNRDFESGVAASSGWRGPWAAVSPRSRGSARRTHDGESRREEPVSEKLRQRLERCPEASGLRARESQTRAPIFSSGPRAGRVVFCEPASHRRHGGPPKNPSGPVGYGDRSLSSPNHLPAVSPRAALRVNRCSSNRNEPA